MEEEGALYRGRAECITVQIHVNMWNVPPSHQTEAQEMFSPAAWQGAGGFGPEVAGGRGRGLQHKNISF